MLRLRHLRSHAVIDAPVILGLLQNQWAHNPQRVRETLERFPDHRRRFIRYMLAQSHTGRRLREALGHWFDIIVWDNASPVIARRSRTSPPPDPVHVQSVLDNLRPSLTVTFGLQAHRCLDCVHGYGEWLHAPHPASRDLLVMNLLYILRGELDRRFPEVCQQERAAHVA